MTNKKEMRQKLLEWRKNFAGTGEKIKADSEIFENLLREKSFKSAKTILTYVSTDIEVNTLNIINYCFENNINVAVPKVEGDFINFYKITGMDCLAEGYFHIQEPIKGEKITDFTDSCCIVPALCYNKAGYRIGYGKGFYDRFLSNYNGSSIGITYNENICEFEYNNFDVSVDLIITNSWR